MATYTQPTGFLAATFPTTVASTTNITAASGITVSSIGNNVITAASIASDAFTAAKFASDVTTEFQSGLATAASLATVAGYLDTEVAAILEDTGTTIPAQIAALNNLSSAQAQTAAAAALTAYDPPTQTELLAAHSTTDGLINTVDTVVDAVKAKTDNLPSDPADASVIAAAFAVTDGLIGDLPTNAELATALGDIPTAAENAAGLLDMTNGVEGSLTVKQALRAIFAALAGKLSGAGTTTITIKNRNDDVNRLVATVDADGNRTAITYDLS